MATSSRTIVWIASYPKSGNTWLRFLASNLLFGRQESAAALNDLVPDVHELGAAFTVPTERRLLKTHFTCVPRLQPLLPYTAAAVYVVRNPADVLVSNYHYSLRTGNTAPLRLADYAHSFIANRGDPRWAQLGMGTWDENVRSWWRTDLPFPVLRLKYEDILADPAAGARVLSELLGKTSSPEEIARVVKDSSFNRMRQIEEADIRAKRVGIFYKPYLQSSIDSGMRFMRGGRAGDAAEALSEDQKANVVRAFSPLLQELGYTNSVSGSRVPGRH